MKLKLTTENKLKIVEFFVWNKFYLPSEDERLEQSNNRILKKYSYNINCNKNLLKHLFKIEYSNDLLG